MLQNLSELRRQKRREQQKQRSNRYCSKKLEGYGRGIQSSYKRKVYKVIIILSHMQSQRVLIRR